MYKVQMKKEDNKYIFYNEFYPDFKLVIEKNGYKNMFQEVAKLALQYYIEGYNNGFAKGYFF